MIDCILQKELHMIRTVASWRFAWYSSRLSMSKWRNPCYRMYSSVLLHLFFFCRIFGPHASFWIRLVPKPFFQTGRYQEATHISHLKVGVGLQPFPDQLIFAFGSKPNIHLETAPGLGRSFCWLRLIPNGGWDVTNFAGLSSLEGKKVLSFSNVIGFCSVFFLCLGDQSNLV